MNSSGQNAGLLVVAEVAQAHDGSLGTAHAYIDAIADAGADAVKFQVHFAEAESTRAEPWRVRFSPQDASRFDYWKRLEFTPAQWRELQTHARERKLAFVCSPFSLEAVCVFEETPVDMWKIASGELVNFPLLRAVAAQSTPVVLSSGMSDWRELDAAVEIFEAAKSSLTVLQCTSLYPCPPEKIGFNIISELRERYGCKVGLSDHSGTIFASLAAAALGADMIEIHVAFSKKSFGPDVSSSIDLEDLACVCEGVRYIRTAVNAPRQKQILDPEISALHAIFQRSLAPARSLPKGHILSESDIVLKKPGTGLSLEQKGELLGRRLARDARSDELFAPDHFESSN